MKNKRNLLKNRGFSLIELSIVLMIVGLLLVPVLNQRKIDEANVEEGVTQGRMNTVKSAINKFVSQNGRYPVPARFTDSEGDLSYGSEGVRNPALCSSASWPSTDGMCITSAPSNILIGAVPFNAININAEEALDYWSNKFTYAVTMKQTSAGTFVREDGSFPYEGTIEVQALDNADTSPPGVMTTIEDGAGNTEFREMILISHGEAGVGAYSVSGTKVVDCRIIPEFEDENCDLDDVFILDSHPAGTIDGERPSTRSYNLGGRYYDDFTHAQIMPELGVWATPAAPSSIPLVWTGGTHLGVGTNDPQRKIHVEGSIQADNKIKSKAICYEGASEICFDPIIIVGNEPQMDCVDNPGHPTMAAEPVIAIGNEQVYCGSTVSGGATTLSNGKEFRFNSGVLQRVQCPVGELVYGFDSAGSPLCDTPTP